MPATLQDTLLARLDRGFDRALLARIADLDPADLATGLDALVAALAAARAQQARLWELRASASGTSSPTSGSSSTTTTRSAFAMVVPRSATGRRLLAPARERAMPWRGRHVTIASSRARR